MARRGLPLWAVQYQGRWGGDSVRLYTAQAYADRYASLSLDAASSAPVERGSAAAEHWEIVSEARLPGFKASELEGAEAVNECIGGGAKRIIEEPAEGMVPIPPAPAGTCPRYVLNRSTGLAHRLPAGWAVSEPLAGWKAACGWTFGSGADALLVVSQPARPWCGQPGCFKGAPPPDDNDSGDSLG